MSIPLHPAGGLVNLRDFFAAAALQRAMGFSLSADEVAENAYAIADAMLRTRANAPTSWPTLHGSNDFSKD